MTRNADTNASPQLPREIAPGIHWFGPCNSTDMGGGTMHVHLSVFLLLGATHTLLIDTSTPTFWPKVAGDLERLLGGRTLDYILPTHCELPHSSNLPLLLTAYPAACVVGDLRDYHLYYPEFAERFEQRPLGVGLDLGGLQLTFVEAVLRDLPTTVWVYEATRQVMFVADGFSYVHTPSQASLSREDPETGTPYHMLGECALTTGELQGDINEVQAAYLLRSALWWSRYVNADQLFRRVADIFEEYPTKVIAPAHGNVIVDPERIVPIIRDVHRRAGEFSVIVDRLR